MAAETPKDSPVETVLKAINRSPDRVDYVDLAYAFIEEAGGMHNMAALMWKEWKEAKAGSLARQRLMAAVLDVLRRGQDKIKADEASSLSDEELETRLKKIMTLVDQAHSVAKEG